MISREYIVKGLKFSVVGAIGSLLMLGVTYAITEWLHAWYIHAEIVGILFGAAFNYNANIKLKVIRMEKN
jgi:putative flippase GtrA